MTDTPDLTTPEGMRAACAKIARDYAEKADERAHRFGRDGSFHHAARLQSERDAFSLIATDIAALSVPSAQEGPPRALSESDEKLRHDCENVLTWSYTGGDILQFGHMQRFAREVLRLLASSRSAAATSEQDKIDAQRWRAVREVAEVCSAGPKSSYYLTTNRFMDAAELDHIFSADKYADALAGRGAAGRTTE